MAKKTCKGTTLPQVKLALEKHRCLPGGDTLRLSNPDTIARFATEHFGCEPQERVIVFSLDARNQVLNVHEASVGGLDQTAVDPRVVLAGALLSGASGIVMVHNHPSGDPEPSRLDADMTEQIERGARLVAIRLLDHIVIGRGGQWVSMLQRGFLKPDGGGLRGYGDEEIAYGGFSEDEEVVSPMCDIGHCQRCSGCACGCHRRPSPPPPPPPKSKRKRLRGFDAAPQFPKMCSSCGREFSEEEWATLEFVGYQEIPEGDIDEPAYTLELRNCPHDLSTLVVRVDGAAWR